MKSKHVERKGECPECGRMIGLTSRGRFRLHTTGEVRDYCAGIGKEPETLELHFGLMIES